MSHGVWSLKREISFPQAKGNNWLFLCFILRIVRCVQMLPFFEQPFICLTVMRDVVSNKSVNYYGASFVVIAACELGF